MTSSKYHKLAIGTAQFGMEYGIANTKGKVGLEEMKDILSFAKEYNVNMLDTSIGYGDSERKLGEIGISGWQVVTKLLRIKEDINDIGGRVEKNIHDSLRRMKIDSVYGILFHNPDHLNSHGEDVVSKAVISEIRKNAKLNVYFPFTDTANK